MARYAGHTFRRLQGYGDPRVDQVSLKGDAIRGREQQLMDHYEPFVGNFIRAVAKDNAFGREYWAASNTEFGMLHEYTGN